MPRVSTDAAAEAAKGQGDGRRKRGRWKQRRGKKEKAVLEAKFCPFCGKPAAKGIIV